MKARQIGILLMVLGLVHVASATSILWCSGGAGNPPFDQGWVDLLTEHGYKVDRLADAETMTQEKVDLANTYDLVIVGRDTISDRYNNDNEVELWNSITSPMICQTGYLWRNNRWKWLDSGSTFTTGTQIAPDLAAGDLIFDILFNGALLQENGTFNYIDGSATLAETRSAGNGVLIGHRNYDPQPWVYAAYWPQGVEFYSNSGAYANGQRMALAGGYPGDSFRGGFNLTEDGTQIFLNAVAYMTGRTSAYTPNPAHGSVGVLPDTVLTWKAGLDPNDLSRVNPAIKKHYVWLSNGDPADPNMTLAATIDVTHYDDPAADGVYVPTPALTMDGFYYWMVEEGLDDGAGGTYPVGDPNNLVGPVWTFDTSTLPIITAQPVSLKLDAGQTAVFTVEFDSISSALVTWYKDGSPLPAGGDVTIESDANSSTLTILNVDSGDIADYYAVVTNKGGSADPTEIASLRLKQLLAWYQFEQNADDSAGTYNGTVVGGMDYAAGPVTDGGQAYAADPNDVNYIQLPAGAYPKAGFGNGLDTFTYSCWVNLDPGEGGIILGEFNDGQHTGLRFSINSVENDISVYMRGENGASINPRTSALETDSQWHWVAVTYDGLDMKIYVDGVWRTTANHIVNEFVDWQYPLTLLAVNSRGSINERFTGQVDDMKIYNYALTKDEAAQEYMDVTGGWICDTELPELLYDFDDNCKVDLADFAIFASTWLDENRIYDDGI